MHYKSSIAAVKGREEEEREEKATDPGKDVAAARREVRKLLLCTPGASP
jgi:hypothetical protein